MPEEIQESKHKKKKRRKKHYFLRFLIFVALIVGAIYALRSELFNVKEFVVEGNYYYTDAQIQQMSGLVTGVNMFKQKLGPAKSALKEDPYIRDVSMKRKPMGTIEITIEERTEYASVPDDGQYAIVDEEGMVLRKSDDIPSLPVIEGLDINAANPGEALDVEQNYLLTNTLTLLEVMNENDIYFKRIVCSKVIVRAYIYDELYCEGKPENITEQMPAVKRLVEEQYAQGIVRGVIKVSKDNYIAFSPVVDEQ